jgi:hypothetical protein
MLTNSTSMNELSQVAPAPSVLTPRETQQIGGGTVFREPPYPPPLPPGRPVPPRHIHHCPHQPFEPL